MVLLHICIVAIFYSLFSDVSESQIILPLQRGHVRRNVHRSERALKEVDGMYFAGNFHDWMDQLKLLT